MNIGIANVNVLNTDIQNSNPLNMYFSYMNNGTDNNPNTLNTSLQLPEQWYWETLNHACHHNLPTNQ